MGRKLFVLLKVVLLKTKLMQVLRKDITYFPFEYNYKSIHLIIAQFAQLFSGKLKL